MTAERSTPSTPTASVPPWVAAFSPVLKFLLERGIPLGFNRLVTIRGRKSGQPRRTALAVITVDGRRWVWAPWGEVNWVRNLRAAGGATISFRGGTEAVRATELNATERLGFFRDVLRSLAHRLPLGVTFIRVMDQVDVDDPVGAADGRVVFELHPLA
jgi:deazaflavin-dependent oxidoreductase (nitroreductase family)